MIRFLVHPLFFLFLLFVIYVDVVLAVHPLLRPVCLLLVFVSSRLFFRAIVFLAGGYTPLFWCRSEPLSGGFCAGVAW
jgi:hypothetical protein